MRYPYTWDDAPWRWNPHKDDVEEPDPVLCECGGETEDHGPIGAWCDRCGWLDEKGEGQ